MPPWLLGAAFRALGSLLARRKKRQRAMEVEDRFPLPGASTNNTTKNEVRKGKRSGKRGEKKKVYGRRDQFSHRKKEKKAKRPLFAEPVGV